MDKERKKELADLDDRFSDHHPSDEYVSACHTQVRETLLGAARSLSMCMSPGRESSLAITKLEEAMYWANASIARHKNKG